MIEEKQIYKQALNKWGMEPQIMMMIEEMSELTKALSKCYRKGINANFINIVEEIVDVQIMLEQMKIMLRDLLPHVFDSEYKSQYEKKLRRLEQLLQEVKQ